MLKVGKKSHKIEQVGKTKGSKKLKIKMQSKI